MISKKLLVIIISASFLLAMIHIPVVNAVEKGSDFQNHCTNPDREFVVGVIVGFLKYNVSSITVTKGECFTIVFQNLDPSVEHDFVIDKVGGSANLSVLDADLTKAEINHVDFDSAGPTTDYGWGPNGIDKFNVLAPQVDASFKYYCDVPGHSTTMNGKLIVGNGGSSNLIPFLSGNSQSGSYSTSSTSQFNTLKASPGFEIISVVSLMLVIAFGRFKKSKK